MNRRTRHMLVTLAAAAASAPAGASALSISVDGNIPAYPGGYLKGPTAPIHFTVYGWNASAFVREVEVRHGLARSVRTNPNLAGPDLVTLTGLFDGSQDDLILIASQLVPGPGGFPRNEEARTQLHVRIDATPPSAPYVTLNPGSRFTNRFSVPINIAAGGDVLSGVGSGEIRNSQADLGACSTFMNDDGTGCFAFPRSHIYNGTLTLAPGPDGPRTAWVRTRDTAFVSCASPGQIAFNCDHLNDGNISAAGNGPATVLLDTTPPTAALTTASPTAVAGTPLPLDASASSDPGGDVASGVDPKGFRWDFGDGSPVLTGQAAAVTHLYPGPGSYKAEVRATDRAGNAGALTFTAVVNVAPGPGGGTTTPTPVTTPTTPAPVTPPASSVGSGGAAPATPGGTTTTPTGGGTAARVVAPKITGLQFVTERGLAVTTSTAGRVRIRVLNVRHVPIMAAVIRQLKAGTTVIPSTRLMVAKTKRRSGRLILTAQLTVGDTTSPVRTIGVAAADVAQAGVKPKTG